MLAAGARSKKRRIFDLLRLARGDRSRLVDRASDGAAHRDRRRGVRAGTKSDDRRLDRLREQPYRKPRLVVGLPRGAESLARGAVRRRALGEYRRGEVVVRRGRRHRGGASPDRDARAAAARGDEHTMGRNRTGGTLPERRSRTALGTGRAFYGCDRREADRDSSGGPADVVRLRRGGSVAQIDRRRASVASALL